MVHAHILDRMPGRHRPCHSPSAATMRLVKLPRDDAPPTAGSTCQRCFRQSSGFVSAMTAAPVKHDAPISTPREEEFMGILDPLSSHSFPTQLSLATNFSASVPQLVCPIGFF